MNWMKTTKHLLSPVVIALTILIFTACQGTVEIPEMQGRISTAQDSVFLVMDDSTLLGWGTGFFGDGLWRDASTQVFYPMHVMDNISSVSNNIFNVLVINNDGELWTMGRGFLGDGQNRIWWEEAELYPAFIMDDVVAASSDGSITAAITSDNGLWIWGSGFLGDGSHWRSDDEAQLTPIRIMDDVIAVAIQSSTLGMAVTSDGGLWAWGIGLFGDGELRGWEDAALTPIRVMDNVINISVEFNKTMIITDDNELWAWGAGGFLGNREWRDVNVSNFDNARLTPVHILDDIVSISTSPTNAMAVKSDGSLWAWGAGILGDGKDYSWENAQLAPIHIMDNVAVVSTSGNDTIAITTDGKVWTWGLSHRLGDGSFTDRLYPGHIMNIDGSPLN
ncbi:MAG: hypothetical protein FWC73_01425 [Defluviitaleaceae bacterium]|nr:hypothetical protein [Defluviitaleaceae bacterium]